jgi:beta-phosphoglucomutase-like phosphatase (HAD superfamily)
LPLRLAIFDIDGTLTATNEVDDECFLRAVSETLGVDCGAVDWSDMPHVTDSAIARSLWTRDRGREPTKRDIQALQRRFHDAARRARESTKSLRGHRRCGRDLQSSAIRRLGYGDRHGWLLVGIVSDARTLHFYFKREAG